MPSTYANVSPHALDSWFSLLQQTKATDILGKQQLVLVHPNQTVGNCLDIMKEHGITGVPVLQQNTKKGIGFVDVLDICYYAIHLWRKCSRTIKLHETTFFNTKVSDIMDFSAHDDWIELSDKSSLLECMNNFHNAFYSHRIALVNSRQELTGVISMSDIVLFAAMNLQQVPWKDVRLTELHVMHACLMVRYDAPLCDSLWALYDNHISGLALVNWENQLVANLSASDLKGMAREAFDMFDKKTINFLRRGTEVKSKIPPVSLPVNASFGDALLHIAEKGVHRVFVLNQKNNPVGIMSNSDILSVLTPKAALVAD